MAMAASAFPKSLTGRGRLAVFFRMKEARGLPRVMIPVVADTDRRKPTSVTALGENRRMSAVAKANAVGGS